MGRGELRGNGAGYGALDNPNPTSVSGGPQHQMSGETWTARGGRRRMVGEAWRLRQIAPKEATQLEEVGECILLFGAFCNGEGRGERGRF